MTEPSRCRWASPVVPYLTLFLGLGLSPTHMHNHCYNWQPWCLWHGCCRQRTRHQCWQQSLRLGFAATLSRWGLFCSTIVRHAQQMSVCAFVRVLHLKVVSGVATNSVPGVDPAMESLTGAPLQLCPILCFSFAF